MSQPQPADKWERQVSGGWTDSYSISLKIKSKIEKNAT